MRTIKRTTENKYKNKKVLFDDILFDSQLECDFYKLLKEQEIENYELQPRFELQEGFVKADKKVKAINYVADFRVFNKIIDIKGFQTTDFKLKKKMFDYKYPDLELILLTKCPLKYIENESMFKGFIECSKLEKLRKIEKNKKSKI